MPSEPVRSTGAARSERAGTRTKILRAAEQLFAREGFDRVTLRQIARAADQRNVAAVQYHFGSKQGLLEAILEDHREAIDARRGVLLAERESEAGEQELASLIGLLVQPLAEKLDDPSGRSYLRIQAQGLSNETMRPVTRSIVGRIARALRGLGATADETDFAGDPLRSRFALLLLFHALADRARQEETGRARRADRNAYVESLGGAIERVLRG